MNGTEVNPRYSENALKEKAFLQELNKKPPLQKFFGYCKLSGPGFMNAAFTPVSYTHLDVYKRQ